MKRMYQPKLMAGYACWSACLILLAIAQQAAAGDFFDEPYQMRLLMTLDRSTNYTQTAAQQASIADAGGASSNPASDDVRHREEADWKPVATLTSINAMSTSGAWITAEAFTVKSQLPEAGKLSFTYAYTDTPDGSNREGLDNVLRSNEFIFGYSHRLSDQFSFGATCRLTDAVVKQETVPAALGVPARISSDLFAVDFTLGVRWAINDQWATGLTVAMGEVWSHTKVHNIVAIPFALPAGTQLSDEKDRIHSQTYKWGVGYTINEQWRVLADLQYLHINSDNAGSMDNGRFLIGANYSPNKDFNFGMGLSVDAQADVTGSAGLFYTGWDHVAMGVAYQYNSSPEIRPEFGIVHLVSCSLVIIF